MYVGWRQRLPLQPDPPLTLIHPATWTPTPNRKLQTPQAHCGRKEIWALWDSSPTPQLTQLASIRHIGSKKHQTALKQGFHLSCPSWDKKCLWGLGQFNKGLSRPSPHRIDHPSLDPKTKPYHGPRGHISVGGGFNLKKKHQPKRFKNQNGNIPNGPNSSQTFHLMLMYRIFHNDWDLLYGFSMASRF